MYNLFPLNSYLIYIKNTRKKIMSTVTSKFCNVKESSIKILSYEHIIIDKT